jgi:hypothetical protein
LLAATAAADGSDAAVAVVDAIIVCDC